MAHEEHAAAAEQVVERITYPDGRVVERVIRRDAVTTKRSNGSEAWSRFWNGSPVKELPRPMAQPYLWYIESIDVSELYARLRESLDRALHSPGESWSVVGSGASPGTWVRYKTRVGLDAVFIDLLAAPEDRPNCVMLRFSGNLSKRGRRKVAEMLVTRIANVVRLTYEF